MGVIIDMVDAVAMIPAATGAVTEFQAGVGDVGTAADGALVEVILLLGGGAVRAGLLLKVDDFGAFGLFSLAAAELHSPGSRQKIGKTAAKENKIVSKAHQNQQVVGEDEPVGINGSGNHYQIHQRHHPGFHGNDEENQELGIRIGSGEGDGHT